MRKTRDPYSILNKDPEKSGQKPMFDPSVRIERYRPNVLPKWSQEDVPEPSVPSQPDLRPLSISIDSTNFQINDLTTFPSTEIERNPMSQSQDEKDGSSEDIYEEEEYDPEPQIPKPLFKPVFVGKEARITETESALQEKEESDLSEAMRVMSKRKKEETQRMISEALVHEEKEAESDPELISDEDDPGDPSEFKKWKLREIKRVVRESEERTSRSKELAEIARRRNMSDWERQEENKKLGTDATAKPERSQMNFMQKWHHQGAFFQERDEHGRLDPIFMRDVNAPVEGDQDKSAMPTPLQKRRGDIGQKGQSKWRHLTAEDTTDFNPAFMPDEKLVIKQQMRQGGFKGMNRFSQKRHES